jgi:hypothetical protein
VATLLAGQEKISLPSRSRFLRHKSLRTTEVYLRKPDESLRDAAKGLENSHQFEDLNLCAFAGKRKSHLSPLIHDRLLQNSSLELIQCICG